MSVYSVPLQRTGFAERSPGNTEGPITERVKVTVSEVKDSGSDLEADHN